MTLILEANFVYFPEKKPHPFKDEDRPEWNNEFKEKMFHQESEIHFLKLSPVDQELLDSKLVHMDLQGIHFTWNEKRSEYVWSSGEELKPLPMKYFYHFKDELKKVGIQNPDHWRTYADFTETCENVEKTVWKLECKF